MKYYILTGTSRGLGEALAEQLLLQGNHLICISRNRNEGLMELARDRMIPIIHMPFDLSQVQDIEKRMEEIFSKIDKITVESIVLINNAGIVTPIKPVELCTSEEIINSTQVNMTAPMILSAQFAAFTSDWEIDKQILNISSGAGKNPYYGWSSYCSAKAGLDLFTRCMGLEQTSKPFPIRVLSISPGVIDTDMQKEIRDTPKENFHSLDRFITLKEEGMLLSPEVAANSIIEIMNNDEFANGSLLDIRDL